MTAQGVGQLDFPSCLIPAPPPPIPVMGVVGHTIDSCIIIHSQSVYSQIPSNTPICHTLKSHILPSVTPVLCMRTHNLSR